MKACSVEFPSENQIAKSRSVHLSLNNGTNNFVLFVQEFLKSWEGQMLARYSYLDRCYRHPYKQGLL